MQANRIVHTLGRALRWAAARTAATWRAGRAGKILVGGGAMMLCVLCSLILAPLSEDAPDAVEAETVESTAEPTDAPTSTATAISTLTNTPRRPTWTPRPSRTPRPTRTTEAATALPLLPVATRPGQQPTQPAAAAPTWTPVPVETDAGIPPTEAPPPTEALVSTEPPPPTEVPAAPSYDCSSYRACTSFSSCAEAQAWHGACPGYWNKADSDGDGVICENVCPGG